MSEDMSERMSKDVSERMLEDMLEGMSKDMSERMSKDMSGRMSEDKSEIMSKDMSDRMSKDMSMSGNFQQLEDRVPRSLSPTIRRFQDCRCSRGAFRWTSQVRIDGTLLDVYPRKERH